WKPSDGTIGAQPYRELSFFQRVGANPGWMKGAAVLAPSAGLTAGVLAEHFLKWNTKASGALFAGTTAAILGAGALLSAHSVKPEQLHRGFIVTPEHAEAFFAANPQYKATAH